jgi:Glycosyl transferase family 2
MCSNDTLTAAEQQEFFGDGNNRSQRRCHRVALCMIVKDEEAVIRRAVNSAIPYIDCWIIVDTGSTDSTREVIRDALKTKPGIVVERKWVDFGTNRTQALALCRGIADWAIMIDADDNLDLKEMAPGDCVSTGDLVVPSRPSEWDATSVDGYYVPITFGNMRHRRVQVFRVASDWAYVGAVHEYAHPRSPIVPGHPRLLQLPGHTFIHSRTEGARSRDPIRFFRDAQLLLESLQRDGSEPHRTVFYIANSFVSAGAPLAAVPYFEKRVAMGGWFEEQYISLTRLISINASGDRRVQMSHAWKAADVDPTRLEAAHALLESRRVAGEPFTQEVFALGLIASRGAASTSPRVAPTTALFVITSVYEWKFDDEFCVVAYWTQHYEEALLAAARAVAGGPQGDDRLVRNAKLCASKCDRESLKLISKATFDEIVAVF